jgi:hypothetical protein
MFQLKVLRRQSASTASRSQPGGVVSEPNLVARIMAALSDALEHRIAVAKSVERAVVTWVASEVRFAGTAVSADAQTEFVQFAAEQLRTILDGLEPERDRGVLQVEVGLVTRLAGQTVVQHLTKQLIRRHSDGQRRLGGATAHVVMRNMLRVSKVTEAQARERPYRVKFPNDIGGSDVDLVATYLGGTPLGTLLLAPVAVTLTDRARLSHGLCIAGSGHGKTQ